MRRNPFRKNFKERIWLTSFFFAFVALQFSHKGISQSVQKKSPNIIVILADDLGWTDLGCFGSDLHETPNIDRLAREGMKFTAFYAASPVCTPTRASILTGKYPARLHMTTHYEGSVDYWRNNSATPPDSLHPMKEARSLGNLPQGEVTIAEALKQSGYRTALVGKWHLGNFEHYPENQGFDVNIGGTSWGAPDTYWYPWTGNNFQKELRYIPGLVLGSSDTAYLTDRLTDKALEVIDAWKNEPFFLLLSHYAPHTPIEAPQELVSYFRKKVKPGMKHQNYEYAAMIASLDKSVGRILSKLDQEGMSRNTVLVFLSDNGGRIGKYKNWETVANNSPLRSGKGALYEGGIRVPLLVKSPGSLSSGTNAFPLSTIDILPTLLDLAGIKQVNVDGSSFASILSGKTDKLDRDFLYWHYPHYYPTTTPVSALRHGPWKLLHFFEDKRQELYNLENDPGERHNLISEHPQTAELLNSQLARWWKDTRAMFPEENKHFRKP